MRDKFIEGARKNKIPEKAAIQVFDLMEQFAQYGFNKSHSTAYALLAYQTAYLKVHYPVQFMAALLSSEIGNTDKIVMYIAECKDMGIPVLPPDINESDVRFPFHGGYDPLRHAGDPECRRRRHPIDSGVPRQARTIPEPFPVLRGSGFARVEQARA